MASIDERIAELEQRIAEKKAYQRMYPSHKYASTWDYVAEGDRSGFDKMDASEAAYHNMLRQQEQQKAILSAQQGFTARENELNRQNALRIAKANDAKQKEANLFNVKKQVSTLLSEKNVLEAQGKPTYQIDSALNVIYDEYPEIKESFANQPQPEYDPRDNPDYQLAKYSKVNYKNTTVEGITEAINTLSKYKTPEAARRLAELDLELLARKKADESGESLRNAIDAFDPSTGELSDYLANKKYNVKFTAGGYKLVDPDGNTVKSPKVKKQSSWD